MKMLFDLIVGSIFLILAFCFVIGGFDIFSEKYLDARMFLASLFATYLFLSTIEGRYS